MFPRSRKRTKAQVVGIGKEGGPITFVAPKRKPFIEIHWWVLGDFLWMLIWAFIVFLLGMVAGIVWAL